MNRTEGTSVAVGPLVSPWPVLGAGLGLVVIGFLWGLGADATLPGLRVLCLAVGLTAIGSALAMYLPRAGADVEGRLMAAGFWVLGAISLHLAKLGLGTAFDSLAVLLQALTVAAVLAAAVWALPRVWRMVGIGVLVSLHFAAILTAVTVVPPPQGDAPYVSEQLFHRVARPYLQLTILNNGYHFYAPEPGPTALVWFRVEFADGASTWVRIPDHPKCTTHVERRRLGALATTISQGTPLPPHREQEMIEKRQRAGMQHKPPIPMRMDMPPASQFREPTRQVMLLLESFVRHVAKTTAHPDGGNSPPAKIKVYRVDYANPPVEHFQAGRHPIDPTLYMATYLGEYDPKTGLLLKTSLEIEWQKDGSPKEVQRDPFLFWQIPIYREPPPEGEEGSLPIGGPARPGGPAPWQAEGKLINCVRIHAGDKDEDGIP